MADTTVDASSYIDAEAFKRLYPEHYFQTFLKHSVRPDGRTFDQSRPATISYDTVTTANASALAKLGSTTALAGIKLEIMAAPDDAPSDGQIFIHIEMPPLCSSSTRPGRQHETALLLTEQLDSLINSTSSNIIDTSQFCIDQGKTAWAVYVDVYILDADGSLFDACLMAIIAALNRLEIPYYQSVDENGIPQHDDSNTTTNNTNTTTNTNNTNNNKRRVQLKSLPLSSTCCLHHTQQNNTNTTTTTTTALIVDPTHDEESVADTTITLVIDEDDNIMKTHTRMGNGDGDGRDGGHSHIDDDVLRECYEVAVKRTQELRKALL